MCMSIWGHDPQVIVLGCEGSGHRLFIHKQGDLQRIRKKRSVLDTFSFGVPEEPIRDETHSTWIHVSVDIYGGDPCAHWNVLPKGTAGVICIVDSSDEERIEQTRVALSGFYERHENLLKKSALLVLANKQDRVDALSVMEVMRKMELETRFEGRRWHIQGTDTISGDGIEEGLEWIAMQISMIR